MSIVVADLARSAGATGSSAVRRVQSAYLEGARSELILPFEHSAFDQAPVLNEIHRSGWRLTITTTAAIHLPLDSGSMVCHDLP
jgi:hypothetical protein